MPLLVAHWPSPSSFLARAWTWYVVLEARWGIVVPVVVPSELKSWVIHASEFPA